MLGALYRYLREADPSAFQPMNANWGLVDPLPGSERGSGRGGRSKDERKRLLLARAEADFEAWLETL
jgi:methylenetetrahydrofolate--tRNA-(uracil-5-)-methyltransferase